jgi:putative lysine/arginine/ornithine/histidine/octopine transport system permease protein
MFDLQGFGPMLMQGTLMTIQVALIATFFGVLIGIVGGADEAVASRIARLIGDHLHHHHARRSDPGADPAVLFRGDQRGKRIARAFGHTQFIDLSAFVAGTAALSLAFGAYATEVFRGAFQSIPRARSRPRARWA